MITRIKKEEYTALGDFILPSFVRDQAIIVAKFPKLNDAFLTAFTTKLNFVKKLESRVVKAEEKKKVTADLYQTAAALNAELTVLNSYVADAGLNTQVVTALKNDLYIANIEGAVLKTEGVLQYVTSNQAALEEEGMSAAFVATLDDFITKLAAKNSLQNDYMNSLKQLTETNGSHYDELYGFISKIANKGKLIFKASVTYDEYCITKNISKMRAIRVKVDDKKLP
ncbi:hypothetical protein [Flavobacterium sp. N1994]|uniref:hypothetical protein n=1 Tax=Flavobacterium sp. N1994 TaxID=2986827 RepID=UPI002222ECFD|nr:hypothetical protein [Flavobacterium sp. N1994]